MNCKRCIVSAVCLSIGMKRTADMHFYRCKDCGRMYRAHPRHKDEVRKKQLCSSFVEYLITDWSNERCYRCWHKDAP